MDINNKITILRKINENRQLLFGKFSDTLTHETKNKKWKEITEELKNASIYNKDWKYLRDTTWQNWRKRAVEKRHNKGKLWKYDDVDKLIIEIICNDSPAIEAVPVPESSAPNETLVNLPAANETRLKTPPPRTRKSHTPRLTQDIDDFQALKKQKMQIEIEVAKEKLEIAKREKYKLDLELLKLEKEQNLQPSSFTFSLDNSKYFIKTEVSE